jgi:DNA-binding SARP family transcriptional activator/tetratricopeptide (TPR) repeat protein
MADNRGVLSPPELADHDLAGVKDPSALLERAWALEPWSRYAERAAALDALEALLAAGVEPAPAGRDWSLELLAERAIDVGRAFGVDEALVLTDQVVGTAQPGHGIALARAMLARGQALAWVGTEEATRQAHRAFAEATDRFAALGHRDWQGSALLRRGYSACYQHGDLSDAVELIREAVATYPPDSMRLAGALACYADVLIELGRFDEAEGVIDRAEGLAQYHHVLKVRIDLTWARAHIAAGRGDAHATERLLREAERDAVGTDWFETHIGRFFLLDAAELLDLLGVSVDAQRYLARGREHSGEDNEEVMQTTAVLRARGGDPGLALEELQQLARGTWLEKRVRWRHTLLTAWATFRAGRDGAGELAARAFEQAVACGGIGVAQAGEPVIAAALAPLAESAGSAIARELLVADRELIIRVFGAPVIAAADGSPIPLPPGMPAELVRLLAMHEHGLPVDVVLEQFFPEASPTVGRRRLRQVLMRLRTAAGEIVVRNGDTLQLVPAWVDLREFLAIGNRVRGASGTRAVQLAYSALALRSGPLLPSDPYAAWAEEPRIQVGYRYLALLDLVARDAAARNSHQEALTALEATLEEDPDSEHRHRARAEQLQALGLHDV